MTAPKRILIEVLGPPFLGTVCFYVFNGMWSFPSFFSMLFFAGVIAIVPSCVYAVLMEVWIRQGWAKTYGAGITVLVSTGLGLAASIAMVWVLPMPCLLLFGIGVGLLLGAVLAMPGKAAGDKHEQNKVPIATKPD